MMLRHLGEPEAAERIQDAVPVTLKQGQAMTLDLVRQAGGDIEHGRVDVGLYRCRDRQPRSNSPNAGEGPLHHARPPRPRPPWRRGPTAPIVCRIDRQTVGLDMVSATGDRARVLGPELEGRRRQRLPPRDASPAGERRSIPAG